jgi:hypothetical protein
MAGEQHMRRYAYPDTNSNAYPYAYSYAYADTNTNTYTYTYTDHVLIVDRRQVLHGRPSGELSRRYL